MKRTTKAKKRGRGRPPKSADGSVRADQINLRVDPRRKLAYAKLASAAGISLSDWIIDSCDGNAI